MATNNVAELTQAPESIVAFVRHLTEEEQSYDGPERRATPRKTVSLPVIVQPLNELFAPSGSTFCAMTSNISGGGIAFIHTDPVDAEYVNVTLSNRSNEKLKVIAKIRHCSPKGAFFEIGARFVVDWNGTSQHTVN